MALIALAKLGKPFGLKGEIKAMSLTSYPKERFKRGAKFVLESGDRKSQREVTLSSCRISGDSLVFSFEEITTVDEAETLRNAELLIDEKDAPLPKDAYRIKDLIGLKAIDQEGRQIGTVKDVLQYGPTPTFRIGRNGEKDFFVPFVLGKFVREVDLEKGEMGINVIEGML